MILPIVILLSVSGGGQKGNGGGLDAEVRKKLDPLALRIAQGHDPPERLIEVRTDAEGVSRYGVIVHTDDPDALRERSFAVGSVTGSLVTARLTREQIIEAARLPSVRYIEASTMMEPMR
jgi:hypothetical protein